VLFISKKETRRPCGYCASCVCTIGRPGTTSPVFLKMKRIHESVDYIKHPIRKQMNISTNSGFKVPSSEPVLSSVQSVSIEGYETKNASGSKYIAYKIRIVTARASWVVYRRYSEFHSVYSELSKHWEIPELPPKRVFGTFASNFIDKRKIDLESWLRKTLVDVDEVLYRCPCVKIFLTKNPVEKKTNESFGVPKTENRTVPKASVASSNASSGSYTADDTRGKQYSENNQNVQDYIDISEDEADKGEKLSGPLAYMEESNDYEMNIEGGDGYTNGQKPKLEDFEMVKVLGKGSFGKVILCRKKDTLKLYAVKILKKKHVLKRKQLRHAKTERSVLGYLNHPFVVKLHYAFQTSDKLYFVLDFLPGGELFFHLGRFGRFNEEIGKFFTAEIALALGHLHHHHVVYRDLKPENILLDAEGHIKLADFGLSKEGIRSGTEGTHSFCGTPEYLAPEVLNRSGHGTSVDWWSLGALLYEMLTGLPPWYSTNRQEMFASIRRSELNFPEYVSTQARVILHRFLERDSAKRLGSARDVDEIKEHSFFSDINWDRLYSREINSPLVPKLIGHSDTTKTPDTRNFDQVFTRMPCESCVEIPSSQTSNFSLPRGGNLSSKRMESLSNAFSGFTFTEESQLKERLAQGKVGLEERLANAAVVSEEQQRQRLFEQSLVNLHEGGTNMVTQSPTGLSSSLMFQ